MKYISLFILLLFVQSIFAQSILPVIKATSKNVAINDDGFLDKNAWTLSPKTKLDVFTADRTRKTKWVTFYTDVDSIKVKVKPGTKFNFIVLLNGSDSCYTQIASAISTQPSIKNNMRENDSIPFTVTSQNAIHVKSIINDEDSLDLHFDTGSFGFSFTKDAILKKTKLLSNQPDANAGKIAPNYNKLNKVFKLQIGNVVWDNPDVGVTTLTSTGMDGRFGYTLFEGKIVEINYDNNLLIIHSKLPKGLKGYIKSKLEFIHSFVCAKGAFEINDKKYAGDFLFDTGSDQAIILDSSWASEQNFPTDLKVLKTSELHDPRGATYKTRVVLAPAFKINDFAVENIPTLILGSRNPVGFPVNYFGNDFLKRFNIILDFQNDCLYLKPNKLMDLKYKENS